MTGKEKVSLICLIISMLLIIISALYTINYNKPDNYSFRFERMLYYR